MFEKSARRPFLNEHSSPQNTSRYHSIALITILLFGLLIFGRAVSVGYSTDDYDLLGQVNTPSYSLLDPLAAGRGTYFRPLVMFSLLLEQKIFSTNLPFFHHLTNLILHLLNGVFVYWIGYRLIDKHWLALGPALFFELHPAQVTNVYWISGRFELMVTFFLIVSLVGFIYFLQTGRSRYLFLTTAALLGSMFSKESGVTTVGAVLAVFILYKGWGQRQEVSHYRIRQATFAIFFLMLATLLYGINLYLRFYHNGPVNVEVNLLGSLRGLLLIPILIILPNQTYLLSSIYHQLGHGIWIGAGMLGLILIFAAIWLYHSKRKEFWLTIWLVTLVMLPSIVLIFLLGGISTRLIYLPLALFSIASSFWVAAKVKPDGKLVKWARVSLLFYLTIPLLALFSFRHGTVWIQNWQATQSYCESFRFQSEKISSETPIFILGSPYTMQNMPVFANDLNQALYYCTFAKFGAFPHLYWVGNIVGEHSLPANEYISVETLPESKYRVLIQNPDLYFDFPSDLEIGQVISNQFLELTITTVDNERETTGFEITFIDPDFHSAFAIFAFTGKEFTVIKLPGETSLPVFAYGLYW